MIFKKNFQIFNVTNLLKNVIWFFISKVLKNSREMKSRILISWEIRMPSYILIQKNIFILKFHHWKLNIISQFYPELHKNIWWKNSTTQLVVRLLFTAFPIRIFHWSGLSRSSLCVLWPKPNRGRLFATPFFRCTFTRIFRKFHRPSGKSSTFRIRELAPLNFHIVPHFILSVSVAIVVRDKPTEREWCIVLFGRCAKCSRTFLLIDGRSLFAF